MNRISKIVEENFEFAWIHLFIYYIFTYCCYYAENKEKPNMCTQLEVWWEE